MLTQEERLQIGLKVLERLKPSLKRRTDTKEEGEQGVNPNNSAGWSKPPSLNSLIDQAGELEPYSVVLGACEDGLPFLLDLTNPAPGSILVAGDRRSGKTRLLRSIIASAALLNRPKEVSYYIIGENWNDFLQETETSHCLEFSGPQDEELSSRLASLSEMVAERRRNPNPEDGAILLAIDDLASLLQYLDRESFSRLYWLIRHGPRSRVWTLAALNSQDAERVDEHLLAAFRTRLVGKMTSRGLANFLAGRANSGAHRLVAGEQFCAPFEDSWVRFWVCDPEPDDSLADDDTLYALPDEPLE